MTKLTSKQRQLLKKKYYDAKQTGSFSGAASFIRSLKNSIPSNLIRNWLIEQRAYTLHVPRIKKFKRRRVICKGIFSQLEVDLIDMKSLARQNNKVQYLLTCVDCFSKKAFVRTQLNKTSETTANTLSGILDSIGSSAVEKIHSDEGKEFTGKAVKKMLTKRGITLFSTYNKELKATIVERFNRTLQSKLYRYMTAYHTDRYVDVLQDIVDSYNNTYHSSLGMTPNEVNSRNAEKVWLRMYVRPTSVKPKPRYAVGDVVRIPSQDKLFRKGYLGAWKEKLYTVSKVLNTVPWTYEISDINGDPYKGGWYEEELTPAVDTGEYILENVVGYKTTKGKRYVKVKWLGYDSSYNTWEPREAIIPTSESEKASF